MAERKPGKKQIGNISAVPFRGGADTVHERALIPSGGFSMVQNMRNRHPGLVQRAGQAEFNTTADAALKTLTLHQFSKGKITERHFFRQDSDNDVLEATNNPPTANTTFGSEVHSGSASPIPASWAELDDLLVYSNGVDQHQIYAGTANYVKAFIKYDHASVAPPDIPENGYDYTYDVTDGQATTYANLSSLNTIAAFECIYINTPIPANRLTWTFGTSKPNGTAAVGTLKYRKSDGTWEDTTEADGTILSGATLGQTGSMIWTHPSDEISHYAFGKSGYWYRWETATQLDAEVQVTSITYGSAFQSIVNVWDGDPPYAVEARFDNATATEFFTFAGSNIEIDSMAATHKLYFNSADPIVGFYVDPGNKPNLTAAITIDAVLTWTGAGFTSCGTVTDETNGIQNPGWVTFPRKAAEPVQFQGANYYSYWYYFEVSGTISDDVIIDIYTMPYFDITEAGVAGKTSCSWQDRIVYSYANQFLYVSGKDEPLQLNGNDFGILEAGDGRSNKVVCQKRFHNELMVWQKEQGYEGGCLTLFEGYSPTTFGKLVLSSKIGTFNAKSAVVVDGVLTSTATDETIKTLAFFLSHYGVCASDGRTVTIISDDIQNYFDPKQTTTCIQAGKEDDMWLEYDSADNVLRLGLVCGASATVPNIFPVFDLTDKTWSFDTPAQELSCFTEVEAASGAIPILQYGGGVDDGKTYRLNTTTNDVSTAIDAYATMEINFGAYWLQLRRLLLMVKAQSAGNVTVTPYRNGVAGTAITLSMLVENAGEEFRRHLIGTDIQNPQISLKFQNATASQELYLLKVGLELWIKEGH